MTSETKNVLETIPAIVPEPSSRELWRQYVATARAHPREKRLAAMKRALYQLKLGRKLINLYEVLRVAGKNERDEPRLAIARADLREVQFTKYYNGGGCYGRVPNNMADRVLIADRIDIPTGTFGEWNKTGLYGSIENRNLKTPVPVIPANVLPANTELRHLYILWEVSAWVPTPPRDPLLLKRITKNLFAVIGQWDLTPLEAAIFEAFR